MDRKWWTLIAVSVATFMLLLDVTIVNVALPDIERGLGSDFTDLQWVVDAYALTLAALLLMGGSIADLFGRRRVFVIGLAIFTAASLACGLASSPDALSISRGVQGIGAAFMFATALALLANSFRGRERGTAFGIWGAVTGASVAVGPLAGGVLTDSFGWESIFFVNVPIGLAAIVLTLLKVEESKADAVEGRTLDWGGVVLFSVALFALIFGLIRGNAEGWGSPLIVALLVGAAVGLIGFVVVERRRAHPMFDLALLRNRSFLGVSLAAFVLSATQFSLFLYLTLYIQNVLGYSPLESGLRFLPTTMAAFLIAPISGKLAERVGIRWFLGSGLASIGIGLLLISSLDAGDDWTALLAGFLISGIGVGLINPALATGAVGIVGPQQAGMASGINSTFRQVGIATGIAGLGAIFQSVVNGRAGEFGRAVEAAGGTLPRGQSGQFSDFISFGAYRPVAARLGPGVERAGREAFLTGLNHIVLLAGIVALVGAALAVWLVRPSDFVSH